MASWKTWNRLTGFQPEVIPQSFLISPKTLVESSAVVLVALRKVRRRTLPLEFLDDEFDALIV